jgi:hypothetical protein
MIDFESAPAALRQALETTAHRLLHLQATATILLSAASDELRMMEEVEG